MLCANSGTAQGRDRDQELDGRCRSTCRRCHGRTRP